MPPSLRRPATIVIYVFFAVFFVVSIADGNWIAAAIIGIALVLLGLFDLGTWRLMRRVDTLLDEVPDVPDREPTDAMLAVDAFDEAIGEAVAVPLTNQVRLDRGKVEGLLERLRTALPRGHSKLSALFSELDELIRGAKPISLTDQIRLDRDEVYDILDRMRASFAEGS